MDDLTILERVTHFKDLGVHFDPELTFNHHLNETVKSAYKMLGFIIRNSATFSNINTIRSLYYAYVRSRLEYCAIVWNPYYTVHKQAVEMVQRKFLKYLYFKVHKIYPERGYSNDLLRQEFSMQSLERRRILSSLTFIVKLVRREIDCVLLSDGLSFRGSRSGSRFNVIFWCPSARTNVMLRSPLFVMTDSFNKICNHFDIYTSPMAELFNLVDTLF